MDAAIARFELLRYRAASTANFDMSPSGYAWTLLNALQIPPSQWASFLAPNGGVLPAAEADLTAMAYFIRRQLHLFESHGFG